MKYPKTYLKVLENANSHRDNEYNPKYSVYVVKKLAYRSDSAKFFFKNLDNKIIKAKKVRGQRAQQRVRRQPKIHIPSMFSKAPKQLPINFYDLEWFNNLDNAEQLFVADTAHISFLPASKNQATQKLNHPDEKLGDTALNSKYWEQISEEENLYHELAQRTDDKESGYGGDMSSDLEESDINLEGSDFDKEEGESDMDVMEGGRRMRLWQMTLN
ncbi:hypothetical protein O181_076066 [Austropuccinia psidii MF-1]|uniref:Uncharacterized protein n=1 Tax=Austropuccinia psidii MF-1 TaxID=1389203 RepID=A0A9Q3IAS5_9BASI|nr:hypothetical protein [Austropuccinia psidii MF-1]